MRKKICYFSFIGVICLSLVLLFLNIQFIDVFELPSQLPMSYEDVETINQQKTFGKNVTASFDEKTINVGGEKFSFKTLVFKLFGFIPIRTIDANVVETKEVYLGGIPLGFSIDVDGLIVLGNNSIQTENGVSTPLEGSKIKVGDIITSVNGNKISSLESLKEILSNKNFSGGELQIEVLRKGEKLNFSITPVLDKLDNTYKLGLWIRNDASGVGTLTFVDTKTLRYGALGHPITDYETGAVVPAKSGKIFSCNVVGLNKGEKGTPGEIKGLFMQGKSQKGTIEKNTQFGVYGQILDKNEIVDPNKTAEVASRLTVKPGKATLISAISGVNEQYEIEIIKASYQPNQSDKSFVFRVTDKRLLELSGGIIQGMSGSPIMQNGKIIGAVTHVFVSDPTKGYGIYIDWMLGA